MKRHGLASLVALLLGAIATAGQNQTLASRNPMPAQQRPARANGAAAIIDTSKWKTYANQKYGFEVKYPETWGVNLGRGIGPDLISLVGPLRDVERASFSLAIQADQNPRRRSIEEWFTDQLHALGDVTPESSGRVTIGGQAAMFMVNTNSFGRHHDTFTLLRETHVLSLGYSSNPEYDPSYAAIVATFRVVK